LRIGEHSRIEQKASPFEGRLFFIPDSSIEPTNRGDFHSGELMRTYEKGCVK